MTLTLSQINVATEIFFTEAIERAKYLDDYLATQKKPLGPFHGLPISVKVRVAVDELRDIEPLTQSWNRIVGWSRDNTQR